VDAATFNRLAAAKLAANPAMKAQVDAVNAALADPVNADANIAALGITPNLDESSISYKLQAFSNNLSTPAKAALGAGVALLVYMGLKGRK
jgi:L-fucose isomerase-like protein